MTKEVEETTTKKQMVFNKISEMYLTIHNITHLASISDEEPSTKGMKKMTVFHNVLDLMSKDIDHLNTQLRIVEKAFERDIENNDQKVKENT